MTDKTHRSAVTGDYSDLRARAEACPPEDDVNSEWYSEDRLEFAIGTKDRPFVAACSPTVILGLLGERDRLRGVNHNLQVALHGANVKIVELEANLDHLRTEDIPVIQQRRDELIARVAELEGLVEVEYAGRNRLAAMVRSIRAFCEAFVEGSEDRDPEPWNPAAYVLSILDGDPDDDDGEVLP